MDASFTTLAFLFLFAGPVFSTITKDDSSLSLVTRFLGSRSDGSKRCLSILNQTGQLARCDSAAEAKWKVTDVDDESSPEAEENSCKAMYEALDCINAASCVHCAKVDALEIESLRSNVSEQMRESLCDTVSWNSTASCQCDMTDPTSTERTSTESSTVARTTAQELELTSSKSRKTLWIILAVLFTFMIIAFGVAILWILKMQNSKSQEQKIVNSGVRLETKSRSTSPMGKVVSQQKVVKPEKQSIKSSHLPPLVVSGHSDSAPKQVVHH